MVNLQFNLFGLYSNWKYESFRIKSANRFSLNLHHSDACRTSKVPKSDLKWIENFLVTEKCDKTRI